VLSGGLSDEAAVRDAYERTGAAAVMLARGSLGQPWLFQRLLDERSDQPTTAEIVAELNWVIDRAEEHLGVERAGRYLRKFYPWYADALGLGKRDRQPLVTAETTDDARVVAAALAEAASLASV
jgi:tRNA-dihydrouridine synthase